MVQMKNNSRQRCNDYDICRIFTLLLNDRKKIKHVIFSYWSQWLMILSPDLVRILAPLPEAKRLPGTYASIQSLEAWRGRNNQDNLIIIKSFKEVPFSRGFVTNWKDDGSNFFSVSGSLIATSSEQKQDRLQRTDFQAKNLIELTTTYISSCSLK